MSKKAVDKIAAGLKDAIAIARGELKPTRVFIPPEIDVRRIRNALAHSQDTFAAAYGFTVSQIRQWEQGRCQPVGALRAYLTLIERDPAGVAKTLQKPLQTPPAKRRAGAR
jgi:putative transcriptional regulator